MAIEAVQYRRLVRGTQSSNIMVVPERNGEPLSGKVADRRESVTERTQGEGRTVLVTGATGALGPAVIRKFLSGGWRVRTLSRRAPEAGTAAMGLPHIAADINDREALTLAMRDVNVVVHMAALLHIVDPGRELEAEYWRVNVEGTRCVMEVARATGVQRVVFISSICVYGSTKGLVDEETKPNLDSLYAATKCQAEEVVLNARSARGGPLGVVLRLGAVYGPTIKGNYARLVRSLARGRFVPLGRGLNRRTLIFDNDGARAVLLAASHPAALGRKFNVTDGSVHTVAAITESICKALGRRPPRYFIPSGVGLAAILLLETLFRAGRRRPPVSRQTFEKYIEDVAVSGDAISRDLGFGPEWNLDRGWRETIEGMRRIGRL